MNADRAVEIAQAGLTEAADPDKAGPMAAYLKTDMAFYGVQKAGRTPVVRELKRSCPPDDRSDYEAVVQALWSLPHREEKYLAIGYARSFDAYVDATSIPLFASLIVEGAWWDLVDEVAIKLVGRALAKERAIVTPIVTPWIVSPDLWLRRTSIICQIGHKEATDIVLLDGACAGNLPDGDFFIRKAIGWALRDYARTAPEWVRAWCTKHADEMSGLSYREATKHLA
ncbi:MAG: DNA alkylation repair protein [Acidimicrobiia bacterium]|nr:DNA alkylation repair protein [Acidimicrobiia bacterium]